MRNVDFLHLVRDRGTFLLWFGQTVSRIGNLIYEVAIGYTVYSLFGSPLDVGVVLSCFTVSQLVTLAVGGTLVDWFSRKNVILVSDLVAGGMTLALVLALWTGGATLSLFCLVSASLGVISAFHLPAYKAIVPEIVEKNRLASFNRFLGVSNSVTRVIGPAVGGGVLAWFGSLGSFFLDFLTFLVAFVSMVFTPVCFPLVRKDGTKRSLSADVKDGFAHAWKTRWLRDLIVSSGLVNFLALAPFSALLPVMVASENLSAYTIGVVLTAQGVGAVLSNLFLFRLKRNQSCKTVYMLSLLIGLGIAAAGVARHILLLIAAGFLTELGFSSSTVRQTLMQDRIPLELQGRIFSLDMLVSFTLLPLAYSLAGMLATSLGTRNVILFGGLGVILFNLFFVAFIASVEDHKKEPHRSTVN
jgi:MFS family permease